MNTPRKTSCRLAGRTALVCGLLFFCAVSGLQALSGEELPETSTRHGWFQDLRMRFENGRLLARAQTAIERDALDDAERHLRKVLENDPGNNRAKVALIDLCNRTERWEEGIALCDDLLSRYPEYVDGYLQKAFMAIPQGDVATAIEAMEEVLARTKPGDERRMQAQRQLVNLYYQAGKYALAENLGKRQLEREDTYALRMLLAECAIAQSKPTEALPHLNAALPLAQNAEQRGTVHLKKGYLYFDLNDFEQARQALEHASGLLPGKVDRLQITRQLGHAAFQEAAYEQAAALFETFLAAAFDEHVAASYIDALAQTGAAELAAEKAAGFLQRQDLSDSFRATMLRHMLYLNKTLKRPQATYEAAGELHSLEPDEEVLLEMAYAAQALDKPRQASAHYEAYLEQTFRVDVALAYYYLLKEADRLEPREALLDRILESTELDPATRIEALYELAQIRRMTGHLDEYFDLMDEVIARSDETRFDVEYADLLVAEQRYAKAIERYEALLEGEMEASLRYAVCRKLAEAYLSMGDSARSRTWLETALRHGLPDTSWHLAMARLDYSQGRFEACIQRLRDLDHDPDIATLYIGFSFYQMGMPGLALHHLGRIRSPEALPPEQRYNLYSNLGYLNFDQGRHNEALAHVEHALSIRASRDMEIVRIKALIARADYDRAREQALELLTSRDDHLRTSLSRVTRRHADSSLKWGLLDILMQPATRTQPALVQLLRRHADSALKMDLMILLADAGLKESAELLHLAGLCELRRGQNDAAVAFLTDCLELDPLRPDAYFLRGLAYFDQHKYALADRDFESYRRSARVVSRLFWADLGIIKGKLGNYQEGTAALQQALEIYPHDIDSMEEAGYQFLKWPSNAQAKASFARAIDTYETVLPYLADNARRTYETNQLALKREYTKLDRRLGAQLYFNKTDYDFPNGGVVSAIDGALPSQLGVELNIRPPAVGFRNERTLDAFGRVLGNFEPDSWRINEDSYQGGVGIRYKPFRQMNAATALERLFEVGDESEDNWLWRILASQEWGTTSRAPDTFRTTGRLYGDIGFFLEDNQRWYYYLEGRAGLTANPRTGVRVTIPQAMGVVRYESDDDANLLSYTLAGIGLNARFLESERRYVTERWYVDVYAHYVWGWFWDEPVDSTDTSFDGLVFGLNFVK